MSFVVHPIILNLFFFCGICPYKYNHITQSIDCTLFRLIYSCVYFSFTSVSIDYVFVIYFYEVISKFGFHTYEIAKILENIARSIIHNFCVMDLLLHRHSYVCFLNKLNDFQRSIESDLGCKVSMKRESFQSMAVIALLIAYLVLISAVTLTLNRELPIFHIVFYILSLLKFLSSLLVGVKICNLNTILLNRYQLVFDYVNDLIKNNSSRDLRFKSLVKCFQKLEELNKIKINFSDTFGTQILLIVSYNFVIMTIALYYSLFSSINNEDMFSLPNFVTFNSPSLAILCWMVVVMDKLGQQVNKLCISLFLQILTLHIAIVVF